MNKEEIIGIMGAMPEEINLILELVDTPNKIQIGDRTYHTGTINKQKVVIVFSRWGKVAAAATTTTLILKFNVSKIIFTGVAGAIHSDLNIGDIVIGQRFFQHDMDARPLMREFEIPLLQKIYFESDFFLNELVYEKIQKCDLHDWSNKIIGIDKIEIKNTIPKIYKGDIASGDQFFASPASKLKLKDKLPTVYCVEMEGAAMAQVCHEFTIPFAVIRVISDKADGQSSANFEWFIENIAGRFSKEIIKNLFA